MQKQDAIYLLGEQIRLKEIERDTQGVLLKNQLKLTIESLKPINLIKGAFTSPEMKNSLVDSAIGMTSGYIAKKAVVRSSKNPFLKLIGTIVGMGVASIVTRHPDGIKSIGEKILGSVLKKEENDTEEA